jgi:hypothetical protein
MLSKATHLLILLAVSATAVAAEPVKVTPPQNRVLSGTDSNQRYVFGQISEFRRDQYMLDTRTGRLWQKVCAKNSDPNAKSDDCLAVLQIVPYVTLDDKYDLTPQ